MTAAEPSGTGPVVFAYDGTELAALAIEEAGRQLAGGRDALVVCVWHPADVGFAPPARRHFDAADASAVRALAQETAEEGAALAEKAGFRPLAACAKAAPTWKGIVEVAEARNASLVVLGSHSRRGIAEHLLGSVARDVLAHSALPVLIVRRRN